MEKWLCWGAAGVAGLLLLLFLLDFVLWMADVKGFTPFGGLSPFVDFICSEAIAMRFVPIHTIHGVKAEPDRLAILAPVWPRLGLESFHVRCHSMRAPRRWRRTRRDSHGWSPPRGFPDVPNRRCLQAGWIRSIRTARSGTQGRTNRRRV